MPGAIVSAARRHRTSSVANARPAAIEAAVAADFPLGDAASADLLGDLAARVRSIHAGETAALDELEAIVGNAG